MSACRGGGRWLEKLGIVPAQPPTVAGVEAELGNEIIIFETSLCGGYYEIMF